MVGSGCWFKIVKHRKKTYRGMLLSPLGLRGRGRGRGLQAADRREREQLLRRPPVQVRLRDGVRPPLQSRINEVMEQINIYRVILVVSD